MTDNAAIEQAIAALTPKQRAAWMRIYREQGRTARPGLSFEAWLRELVASELRAAERRLKEHNC